MMVQKLHRSVATDPETGESIDREMTTEEEAEDRGTLAERREALRVRVEAERGRREKAGVRIDGVIYPLTDLHTNRTDAVAEEAVRVSSFDVKAWKNWDPNARSDLPMGGRSYTTRANADVANWKSVCTSYINDLFYAESLIVAEIDTYDEATVDARLADDGWPASDGRWPSDTFTMSGPGEDPPIF